MSEKPQESTEEIPKPFSWEKAAKDYHVDQTPIVVVMPDGSKPTFMPLVDLRSRRQIEADVDEVLKTIPTLDDKGHKGHWINDAPQVPYEDQRALAELHVRSIAPKMSLQVAFSLYESPTVVEHIQDKLNRADREMRTMYFVKQAELAAEKSKASGNGESSKPSEGDSPDATSTD